MKLESPNFPMFFFLFLFWAMESHRLEGDLIFLALFCPQQRISHKSEIVLRITTREMSNDERGKLLVLHFICISHPPPHPPHIIPNSTSYQSLCYTYSIYQYYYIFLFAEKAWYVILKVFPCFVFIQTTKIKSERLFRMLWSGWGGEEEMVSKITTLQKNFALDERKLRIY